MKILFQTDILNYRGSTVAIADYARYNQLILGNESVICYDAAKPWTLDVGTEPEVVANMQREFNVVAYNDISELQTIIDREKIDLLYNGNGFIPTNCPVVMHEVWQRHEVKPEYHEYAYISEWLASAMNAQYNDNRPYVPHIVTLPEPTGNLREELGIRPEQTVIGRIGGFLTFDLPFVMQAIADIVTQREDFVFVFAGTRVWGEHPNIKYIPSFNDPQRKANFFNTCDATLHARSNGESFGLAVAESLYMNRPVLAWTGGGDQNHTLMLKDSGLIYTPDTISDKLLHVRDYANVEDWRKRVEQFAPDQVMNKFKAVFL
jgi:hypothetical protein